MSQNKLSILYTEDAGPIYERMVPYLELLLNANVTHTSNNRDAERWLFSERKRFDVYIFDDSAMSGGGHGVKIALELAKKLKEEDRGGIVVTVNSSNTAILGGNEEITLEDLHNVGVEFWYKHTEGFTSVVWIASCIKENRQIPRDEWLRSVGENVRYDTFGEGGSVEKKLLFLTSALEYADKSEKETLRGSLFRIDISQFIARLREGAYADKVIREMQGNGIRGEKEA